VRNAVSDPNQVKVRIVDETPAELAEYERVPIAFRVETHFIIDRDFNFIEEPIEPFIKDYDANESERPTSWPRRFDTSRWGIFAAFDGGLRIGGAAVAWRTPELDMLDGLDDLACLWDLRVCADYRGKGIGHELFTRAVEWARSRNCRRLKIETQNINVPACKFYARQGCELKEQNKNAYEEALNETQLIWYLDL
jgi:GNAT superfamily N-acetyltransferase